MSRTSLALNIEAKSEDFNLFKLPAAAGVDPEQADVDAHAAAAVGVAREMKAAPGASDCSPAVGRATATTTVAVVVVSERFAASGAAQAVRTKAAVMANVENEIQRVSPI